ncbi:MAG: response regulator [Phycisphaerae bacterium]|jgi:DNA-binding NtrC family response regulator|nr:response regulator [Phycisphaerae bacterium]
MTRANTIERQERILIVDDEENMRRTLSDILRREGYHTTVAASGEEAVKLCTDSGGFDVVLMDVRMPGISGVDAFREIRRHKEGVRVILMTAYGLEDLKRAALDEGAVAFLPKPLDLEKTIDLIAEVKETAILVVEEDQRIADELSAELSEQGYRVTVTASPHDALELVEQIRFDLVFVDVNLPAMNGLELYLAIKEITPSSVAIMITGMEEEFERLAREAVKRNAYTIVRKPLNIDYVLEMLSSFTGKRASGDLRKPPPQAS